MKLAIDTTRMTFLVTGEPEQVLDFETKRPRADENGQPLYATQLVALCEGAAEIISVKTAGRPPQVEVGQHAQVRELVASPWEIDGRSGIAYRAAQIDKAPAAAKASS